MEQVRIIIYSISFWGTTFIYCHSANIRSTRTGDSASSSFCSTHFICRGQHSSFLKNMDEDTWNSSIGPGALLEEDAEEEEEQLPLNEFIVSRRQHNLAVIGRGDFL
ncbi:ORF309 [White spot syndrome virus]|uniref:Wsv266 n=3 Tax=White spot syndrome virus TaxID=342409 RepID=Q8VAV9_WSSVS|nr:wsv266 [Shrimp white spot syndrome virus]AFX59640.1 wsv266 [White spot syndrome virus]AAL33269.1 wsv266 [Shrimp white spot syndrome virus]AAL89189.1 WSSV321 [Shrimp white spot syndrome virus]ATU83618.1 ORF309 [White spot syndrome virus]AWQ60843.1 wsv266 [Shrimp white spot syndrome virus]